jgi:hypothetical protein
MTFKSKISDDAYLNYSSQVSLYNDTQRIFYERQLPSILSDLQQLDRKRSDELKNIYFHFIQTHLEVLPRIQTCLDEMSKQTEQVNSYTDAQVVIDDYKTGYAIPDDQKVVRYLNIHTKPVRKIEAEIQCSNPVTGFSISGENRGIAGRRVRCMFSIHQSGLYQEFSEGRADGGEKNFSLPKNCFSCTPYRHLFA